MKLFLTREAQALALFRVVRVAAGRVVGHHEHALASLEQGLEKFPKKLQKFNFFPPAQATRRRRWAPGRATAHRPRRRAPSRSDAKNRRPTEENEEKSLGRKL